MKRLGSAALALALAGCAGHDPQAAPAGDLHGVLWLQTAAEYHASCRQAFALATAALDAALADPGWTAALEQRPDELAGKPPAIVVDVDETVVDNSPYNARLLEDGEEFAIDTWTAWARERQADAVPGARAFLDAAARQGVTVFYVTNRGHEIETATRDNLARLGFPLGPPEIDTLLTRGEHDDAGSEKGPRRARVARTHRILLLVGDDLGDFVPGARRASVAERLAMVDRHASLWGERWFVLPNPVYGSWLRALGDEPRGALRAGR